MRPSGRALGPVSDQSPRSRNLFIGGSEPRLLLFATAFPLLGGEELRTWQLPLSYKNRNEKSHSQYLVTENNDTG